MRIILSETSYFRYSNNIQAARNYKNLIAKTFDGNFCLSKKYCFQFFLDQDSTLVLHTCLCTEVHLCTQNLGITFNLSTPDTKANLRKLTKSNNTQKNESLKVKTLRVDPTSHCVCMVIKSSICFCFLCWAHTHCQGFSLALVTCKKDSKYTLLQRLT